MSRTPQARTALLLAGLGLALTGCGADPAPTPTGQPAAATASAAPASSGVAARERCHTAGLTAVVETFVPAGRAGGSKDARIGLTNTTATPCTVEGYPALHLLTAAGQPRTTKTTPTGDRPVVVVVAPRQTAWAPISWMVTPSADESDCGPAATQARVTPPGESGGMTAAAAIGAVCAHGEVFVGAFTLQRSA